MTTKKFDLHQANLLLAKDSIAHNVQEDDGEKCFNLPAYLDDVSMRLDTVLVGNDSPVGRFELGTEAMARYLWCCIALESGDAPDGTTFRGMPILD